MLIGLSVMVDHLIGVPLTGASMNPSRSFGAAVWQGQWADHWIYWIGPIAGSCMVATIYFSVFLSGPGYVDHVKALKMKDEEQVEKAPATGGGRKVVQTDDNVIIRNV
eukprot:TRINITY_DN12380_c0_g1_i1.p2 TRINITY_DN12380_c0_g1~~TRINITY_DN12380_c0_g1_i1.p2  ORF type:complete len:108 (+),score=22.36 TRINITY_DN12380_c0_g1_i1:781-1104(+)